MLKHIILSSKPFVGAHSFDLACSICEKMLSAGELPEIEKVGKVITYLCKGSKAKDAHLIYLFAKEKGRYHLLFIF